MKRYNEHQVSSYIKAGLNCPNEVVKNQCINGVKRWFASMDAKLQTKMLKLASQVGRENEFKF